MSSLIRITSTVLATGAMLLALAAVPATSRNMGGGFHAGTDFASRSHSTASRASSVVKNGPVARAKKKAGKLNGACYRSCVKTSMGDAFRTDQFCAYSCSLD